MFYKQLDGVSCSLALVLVGVFNLPDVCWQLTTVKRQSKRFLEHEEDKFLTHLGSDSTRDCALLDLLFMNREGLVGDGVVGDCLGHNDPKVIEFTILSEVRKGVNKISTLDSP